MERIDIDELAKQISQNLRNVPIFDEKDLDSYIEKASIKITDKLEKPIVYLSMVEDHGAIKDQLTSQNISTTIGGAKSKKTFFTVMMVASLLGYKDYAMTGGYYGNIIWFDTEQSSYHVHRILRRLEKLGCDLSRIEMFGLRPYMPELRFSIIERKLQLSSGQFFFVVIDGIVDLLYDFNNLIESKTLSTKVMEWSSIYDCHINMILHTNKDLANARGHLGSELMNKSETVFKIQKDDDHISKVTGEYCRNEGFKEWSFRIEDGLPKRVEFPTGYYLKNAEQHDDIPF